MDAFELNELLEQHGGSVLAAAEHRFTTKRI